MYWLSTNIISITQSNSLKIEPVRAKLGLGKMIKWKPEELPMQGLNFKDMLRHLPTAVQKEGQTEDKWRPTAVQKEGQTEDRWSKELEDKIRQEVRKEIQEELSKKKAK